MEILLFIIFAIVAAIGGYLAHKAHKARLAALKAWTATNNWTYHPHKLPNPAHPFSLFNSGLKRFSQFHASRTFPDATPGLDPATLRLFEYHYAERRSDGKRTYYQHYHFNCCITQINADLGNIFLRDEHFGDKLAQTFGLDDIDLENPEFSKKFMLKAKDRKDAYDLFDANMMDFMVNCRGWVVETRTGLLFVYRSGKVSPEAYDSIAAFTRAFLAHLPRLLVNTQRAKQNLPPLIEGGSVATRYSNNNQPIPNQHTQAQEN